MANVGGPRSSSRRLSLSSIQTVLMYGAGVWVDVLNEEVYRMWLARVLGGRGEDQCRGEDKARTVGPTRAYQLRQETRGRWTRRLIRQVRLWVNPRYGEVNFYLTQFLTGHGLFRSCLFRMDKAVSPDCIY
ncbi:uncharacterized protein LOC129003755 [Macrosteles quadrilineatus]|uniref:uncharacterized protein LOC129003755 n=1 Tax=Macrosteles quadrilineatus TaxID=74068 RepID=UPI0023E2BA8D|nr:uncharacterized protein LOC129003755 [Macrosteles quadrilineatus]